MPKLDWDGLWKLALGCLPLVLIWTLGFGALNNINDAYDLACNDNAGLTRACPGISQYLDRLDCMILVMLVLYVVAAIGVLKILEK